MENMNLGKGYKVGIGGISIPLAVLDHLGWKSGDMVWVGVNYNEGLIELTIGQPPILLNCQICGRNKSIESFSKKDTGRYSSCCNKCNGAYRRLNRLADPQKAKAQNALTTAIKYGKIKVPLICSDCGETSDRPIEGHHDDYGEPLEVTWLCRSCHIERHKKESA